MISVQNHLQQLSGNKYKKNKGLMFKPLFFYFFLLPFYFLSACSPKTVPVVKKNPEETVKNEPSKPTEKQVIKKDVKVVEKPDRIISLILPFELNTVNYKTATAVDLRKSEIAIDFYQGFKMGLDSIAQQNKSIDFKLQVFDSNDLHSSLSALSAKAAIKKSDLIVGPVFPNAIKAFSVLSKSMHKIMISPLAASDPSIFNNPYLINVNNALHQHAFKAASFIKSDLKPKKVIIIRSGQADEYKYAVPFKKGMDSLAKEFTFTEIGIKAIGYPNIYKYLNPIGLNVIVLPSTDRFFLLTLFKELEKLSSNFRIAVVGHPGWEKANFLDFNQMERLNTYLTSSYQIDYKANRTSDFVKAYRYKFSLEPSEYAFNAFDIAYYFGGLMNQSEDILSLLLKEEFDGIHNDFKFKKDIKFGYFNDSLMMLKFQNAQLINID